MSGQQIGTIVGGIIGAYFGAPQLGMAIGGLIGGAIDPTKINGPHIGDGQAQTSTTGVPIAWVQGTAKVAGTLIGFSKRVEVAVKDDGKGSGTVTTQYQAHQSYAILVAESDALRGSTINSVLVVDQDGKIVYDIRPESNFAAASAKWKANVDFYFGGEDQMPISNIENWYGVGNTPGYRGRLVVVFRDINISNFGDRIPSYLFTVSAASTLIPAQSSYKYLNMLTDDGVDRSASGFDDSSWTTGSAPFGAASPDISNPQQYWDKAHAYDNDFLAGLATGWPTGTVMWLRHEFFLAHSYSTLQLKTFMDDHMDVFINGTKVLTTVTGDGGIGTTYTIPASACVVGRNVLAVRAFDENQGGGEMGSITYFDLKIYDTEAAGGDAMPLANVVSAICIRGGLKGSDIDVSGLGTKTLVGYPIATDCTADQALAPLLQPFFAFGTEIDGKLVFKYYGEDAVVTGSLDDLVINDATDGAIQRTRRNQATEYPYKVTVQYVDPTQNYNTNTVSRERSASTVIAIGETTIQVPVVMNPDDAAQAADKALKVAYATLEGTDEYSVPWGSKNATYLLLCAGEPIILEGKRWVLDELDISPGSLHLQTRYDRQSAYQSNVQAIPTPPPNPPVSMYSGPTDLMVMNLPSLRPQDTYGVYLAAKGTETGWKGCTVQVSYDGQESWQNAITIGSASIMGVLLEDEVETGSFAADTLVDIGEDDALESVSDAQLDANANAYTVVDATDVAEIRQFKTATLEGSSGSDNAQWWLSEQRTGLLGTTHKDYVTGDKFTMLDNVSFLPIDISFAGKTLYFRAVGFGEIAEDQPIISLEYNPDTTIIYDGGSVT